MNIHKVTFAQGKGKSLALEGYDHYVALDWSLKVMAIGHMTRNSREVQVFERPADIKVLREYLCSLRGRKVIAFEETTTAHWLYLELCDDADRIIICDPYQNRLLCHGPKSDTIDARKLCQLLRAGLLKEVFHTADELYELRSLVSAYEDVIEAGVRAINQRSALQRAHGDKGKNAPFILEHLTKCIELYKEAKEHYEAKFQSICGRNPQLKRLLAVPGIGTIGAVKILATVVDARRFARAGKYLCYCGLVKHEKFSGGRSYGRRKPRYSHTLKAVYKTAAMAAIGGKNPIRDYYDSLLVKGVADHNARHAVARYIAKVTYGILKTGTGYEPYHWRKNTTERRVA